MRQRYGDLKERAREKKERRHTERKGMGRRHVEEERCGERDMEREGKRWDRNTEA